MESGDIVDTRHNGVLVQIHCHVRKLLNHNEFSEIGSTEKHISSPEGRKTYTI
jgi:hypothetical protein